MARARRSGLTDDEFVRLARVFVGLGRDQHPADRRRAARASDARPTWSRGSRRSPRPELSLTTNGVGLDRSARKLADAGLRPDQHLARHPRPATVRPARPAATGSPTCSPGSPPRPTPGWPAQDQLSADARREPRRGARRCSAGRCATATSCASSSTCRSMPTTPGPRRHGDRGRDARPCSARTTRCARSGERGARAGRGVRRRRRARPRVVGDGVRAGSGVIASVTRPFCRECDRLRLTADGQLRTCLFAQTETDLRGPLRTGASDAELAELIVDAPSPASRPATASARPVSCSPRARCPPSAADHRAELAPVIHSRRGVDTMSCSLDC